MGNYLGKQTWSLRRHEWRPSYTHSAAPVLGPRAATPGVAANPGPSVDVSSAAGYAAPTGTDGAHLIKPTNVKKYTVVMGTATGDP